MEVHGDVVVGWRSVLLSLIQNRPKGSASAMERGSNNDRSLVWSVGSRFEACKASDFWLLDEDRSVNGRPVRIRHLRCVDGGLTSMIRRLKSTSC